MTQRPNKKRILVIGSLFTLDSWGKLCRVAVNDLRRFADVKVFCIPTHSTNLQMADAYKNIVTTDVKGYDGVLSLLPLELTATSDKTTIFYSERLKGNLSSKKTQSTLKAAKNILTTSPDEVLSIESLVGTKAMSYLPQLFIMPMPTIQVDKPYIFYTISSDNEIQDHVLETIITYFTTFTRDDKVAFRILLPQGQKKKLEQSIQDNLAFSPLRNRVDLPPLIVTDEIVDDDSMLFNVHQMCDCYISASYINSFNMPLYEAAKMGKRILYNTTPFNTMCLGSEWVDGELDTYHDIPLHVIEPNKFDTYNSMEYCVSLINLSNDMRESYKMRDEFIPPVVDWMKTDTTKEVIVHIGGEE